MEKIKLILLMCTNPSWERVNFLWTPKIPLDPFTVYIVYYSDYFIYWEFLLTEQCMHVER
jgi:hypothetical protein